jgi:hypothetical protein
LKNTFTFGPSDYPPFYNRNTFKFGGESVVTALMNTFSDTFITAFAKEGTAVTKQE